MVDKNTKLLNVTVFLSLIVGARDIFYMTRSFFRRIPTTRSINSLKGQSYQQISGLLILSSLLRGYATPQFPLSCELQILLKFLYHFLSFM